MKVILLALCFATSLNAATMAINVLFTTNDETKEWAEKVNKEFFNKFPKGFRFDDSHLQHISLYQSYVEISCLDDKWDDIEKEVKASKVLGEKLEVRDKSVTALPAPSTLGLASLNLKSNQKLMKLQKRMSEILAPCKSELENPKAFYGTVPADNMIIAYTKNFETAQMGESFSPHISLGVAEKADADKMLEAHTLPSPVKITRIGVFRMGTYGTARERLFSFD